MIEEWNLLSETLCYILQVSNLCHSPFSMLIKGAVDATEDIFIEAIPVVWELLLESDQQLAATAGEFCVLK